MKQQSQLGSKDEKRKTAYLVKDKEEEKKAAAALAGKDGTESGTVAGGREITVAELSAMTLL